MLKGYAAWTKWRQIGSDEIKIALIKKLMAGSIAAKKFKDVCGEEYNLWLLKQEIANNLDMADRPWEEVEKAYPHMTTKEMMAR